MFQLEQVMETNWGGGVVYTSAFIAVKTTHRRCFFQFCRPGQFPGRGIFNPLRVSVLMTDVLVCFVWSAGDNTEAKSNEAGCFCCIDEAYSVIGYVEVIGEFIFNYSRV